MKALFSNLFAFFTAYNVSLSHSLVPYNGFVQITIDGRKTNVCWQRSHSNNVRRILCRDLGYSSAYSYVNKYAPTDFKDSTFSGTINCDGQEKYISQCSISALWPKSCSGLSYLQCKYIIGDRGLSDNAVQTVADLA